MKKIDFFKMSGSGNDFIIVDNRKGIINGDSLRHLVMKTCLRKVSVGADGFIVIQGSEKADFKWKFFNADGSEAEMCGNGGRCAAKFAYLKGIAGKEMSFETLAGIIKAEILKDRVKLEMTIPCCVELDKRIFLDGEEHHVDFINTGVPHVVEFVEDLYRYPVVKLGRIIRYHSEYKPTGTNVNFVSVWDRSNIIIRTYERGVEDETLACGTGAVAASLIGYLKGAVSPPVAVKTKGGEILNIHFRYKEEAFDEVYLEGDARVIYEGRLWDDAIIG
ncbi:MAG: diaminopimelate epimerase [Thermodesulfobacteriota bacterium]|nr:diaminopimelate epimerase [Thermodesulfobacteriota bacterium]